MGCKFYFIYSQRQKAFEIAKEKWGHPPKFKLTLIDECQPQNDFEESVVQYMKDSVKSTGHISRALPDIAAGVSAMDYIAQSLVVEVSQLRAVITKREDRVRVISYNHYLCCACSNTYVSNF